MRTHKLSYVHGWYKSRSIRGRRPGLGSWFEGEPVHGTADQRGSTSQRINTDRCRWKVNTASRQIERVYRGSGRQPRIHDIMTLEKTPNSIAS